MFNITFKQLFSIEIWLWFSKILSLQVMQKDNQDTNIIYFNTESEKRKTKSSQMAHL